MTKRKIFLILVIIFTFSAGLFTGMIVNQPQQIGKQSVKTPGENAPQSAKKPSKKEPPTNETENEKVLLGYIQDFRDPTKLDYKNLTHIIFSFAHPTKDGGLLLNGDTALTNLRNIVTQSHKHNTKVILAVGGWYHIEGGESYHFFREALTNPSARNKLVNELVGIAEREKLDGIDIDFEHPRSKVDAENLTAFTKALSEKLHAQDKELSIAVNAKIHSVAGTEINNVIYDPTMFHYVDHVNIMAYDGQWDGGYNAANLSPYPYNEKIVNYWATLFDSHDLPRDKLVLGVPSYAQPEDPDVKQVSYAAVIENNPENAKRDTVSMNGTNYHYNGEETVRKKTKLALEHGFGGMMMWEIGLDAKGTSSLTFTISEALKLANQVAYH